MTSSERIQAFFDNPDVLNEALVGMREQLIRTHRAFGVPLATWRYGRVVYVDPETLEEISTELAQQMMREAEARL